MRKNQCKAQIMTRKQITSLILLGASILYDIIPVDFIPEAAMPFLGLLDDFLLTSSAAINCFQQFWPNAGELTEKISQWLKWICLVLAILIIIVVILLAGTIYSLVK